MLIDVRNLHLEFETGAGSLIVLQDISFSLDNGERLGIVGESGCGKTTLAKAFIRLLPEQARLTQGEITYKGQKIWSLPLAEVRKLRWREIAYIPQQALHALNPVYTVQDQLLEVLQTHASLSKREALHRAESVMQMVGLDVTHLACYPHQLSGGMRQRVLIAMSLLLKPSLIVADEPTTALDMLLQRQIVQQLIQAQEQANSSLILISHDLALITEVCDSIMVMYAGKIMEKATTKQFLRAAVHPYTIGLVYAYPRLEKRETLISIPGSPPDLTKLSGGCGFHSRCPFATELCVEEEPALQPIDAGHDVACHYAAEADRFRVAARERGIWLKKEERFG